MRFSHVQVGLGLPPIQRGDPQRGSDSRTRIALFTGLPDMMSGPLVDTPSPIEVDTGLGGETDVEREREMLSAQMEMYVSTERERDMHFSAEREREMQISAEREMHMAAAARLSEADMAAAQRDMHMSTTQREMDIAAERAMHISAAERLGEMDMSTAQLRAAREAIERSEETISRVAAIREQDAGSSAGTMLGLSSDATTSSTENAASSSTSNATTSSTSGPATTHPAVPSPSAAFRPHAHIHPSLYEHIYTHSHSHIPTRTYPHSHGHCICHAHSHSHRSEGAGTSSNVGTPSNVGTSSSARPASSAGTSSSRPASSTRPALRTSLAEVLRQADVADARRDAASGVQQVATGARDAASEARPTTSESGTQDATLSTNEAGASTSETPRDESSGSYINNYVRSRNERFAEEMRASTERRRERERRREARERDLAIELERLQSRERELRPWLSDTDRDGALHLNLNLGLDFSAGTAHWGRAERSSTAPSAGTTDGATWNAEHGLPHLDDVELARNTVSFSDLMQRMMDQAYSGPSRSGSGSTSTATPRTHSSRRPGHTQEASPANAGAEPRDFNEMRRRVLSSSSGLNSRSWRTVDEEERDEAEAAELVNPLTDPETEMETNTRMDTNTRLQNTSSRLHETSARLRDMGARLQQNSESTLHDSNQLLARFEAFNRAAEDIELAAQRLQADPAHVPTHYHRYHGHSALVESDSISSMDTPWDPTWGRRGADRWSFRTYEEMGLRPEEMPLDASGSVPPRLTTPAHTHGHTHTYSTSSVPTSDRHVSSSSSDRLLSTPSPDRLLSTSASDRLLSTSSSDQHPTASAYRLPDIRHTLDLDAPEMDDEDVLRSWSGLINIDGTTSLPRPPSSANTAPTRLRESREFHNRHRRAWETRSSGSGVVNNGLGAVGDHLHRPPTRFNRYANRFDSTYGSHESPIEIDSDDDSDSMDEYLRARRQARRARVMYDLVHGPGPSAGTGRTYRGSARDLLGSNRDRRGDSRDSPIEVDATEQQERGREFLPRPDLGGTFSSEAASLPGYAPYEQQDAPQPPPMTRSVAMMGIGAGASGEWSAANNQSGGDITMGDSTQPQSRRDTVNSSSSSSAMDTSRGAIAHGGSRTPPWLRARPSRDTLHAISAPSVQLGIASDDSDDSDGFSFSGFLAQEMRRHREQQREVEQLSRQRRDFWRAQRDRIENELGRLSRDRQQAEREQSERGEMFERETERILSESTRPPELPPLAFDRNVLSLRPVESPSNVERRYGDDHRMPTGSSTAVNPTVAPPNPPDSSSAPSAGVRRPGRFGYPPFTPYQGIHQTPIQRQTTTGASSSTAPSAPSSSVAQEHTSASRDIHELMNQRSQVMAARESSGRSLEAAGRSRASMEAARASLDDTARTRAQEAIDRARAAFDRDRSMSEENLYRMLHEREERRRGNVESVTPTLEETRREGASRRRRDGTELSEGPEVAQPLRDGLRRRRAELESREPSGSNSTTHTGPAERQRESLLDRVTRDRPRSASSLGGDRPSLLDRMGQDWISPYASGTTTRDYLSRDYGSGRGDADPTGASRWRDSSFFDLAEQGERPRTRLVRPSVGGEPVPGRFGGRIHNAIHRHHARRRMLGDYMRDEDFDGSYENLLSLASALGEVRPRGTPSTTIENMPSATFEEWKTDDSDTRCPICLDDYSPDDTVMKLPDCSHWLHKECLQQWLKGARTCPICRRRVGGTSSGARSHHRHIMPTPPGEHPLMPLRRSRFRRVGDLIDDGAAVASNTSPNEGTSGANTASTSNATATSNTAATSNTTASSNTTATRTSDSTATSFWAYGHAAPLALVRPPASARVRASSGPLPPGWMFDPATGLPTTTETLRPTRTGSGASQPVEPSGRRPIVPLPARHTRLGSSSAFPARSDSPPEAPSSGNPARHTRAASTSRVLIMPRRPLSPPSGTGPLSLTPALPPRRIRARVSDPPSLNIDVSLNTNPFTQGPSASRSTPSSSAPRASPSTLPPIQATLQPQTAGGSSGTTGPASSNQGRRTMAGRYWDADVTTPTARGSSSQTQPPASSAQRHDDGYFRSNFFDAYASTLSGIDDDLGIRIGRRRAASTRSRRTGRREGTSTRPAEAERNEAAEADDEDVVMANADDAGGSGAGSGPGAGRSRRDDGAGGGGASGGSARDSYMDSVWGPYGGGMM